MIATFEACGGHAGLTSVPVCLGSCTNCGGRAVTVSHAALRPDAAGNHAGDGLPGAGATAAPAASRRGRSCRSQGEASSGERDAQGQVVCADCSRVSMEEKDLLHHRRVTHDAANGADAEPPPPPPPSLLPASSSSQFFRHCRPPPPHPCRRGPSSFSPLSSWPIGFVACCHYQFGRLASNPYHSTKEEVRIQTQLIIGPFPDEV